MMVKCDNCGKEFNKKPSRINKCKFHFCSNKCSSDWQTDENTEFVNMMCAIRRRTKKKKWPESDLTTLKLKTIFENQQKLCSYTGKELKICQKNDPYQASIDRKNSELPYTEDNIEFVCLIAQYAKNTFTKEQVIQFCRDVVAYQDRTA